jgi:hypothetical protein
MDRSHPARARPLRSEWPEDLESAEYLHRGLARILRERGVTVEAATSLRRDLQEGRLQAVVLHPHGPMCPLERHCWRGRKSPSLWWQGQAEVSVKSGPRTGHFEGDIYLPSVPEPKATSALIEGEGPRHVPAFIALMFKAIEHFGMPARVPKKQELVAWFTDKAVPGGGTVTKTQAQHLATFVRPPEAMRGGNKRVG